ncbi:GGDEF domain-containing protein [Actinospica durhamensis]|uniref:GGDEF domain-containing protein n=1 Tax=Actinospica durhamensis TaxID=1508375 RepID=A0A941ETM5_9ACTN|nr:GGDEF domain-containing protein [Actinospica durhamensis]MBR7836826.1 GGDEF domain-containing protein [Actinospica durhamensis]
MAAELGVQPEALRSWIRRDAEAAARRPERGVQRAVASRLLGDGHYAQAVKYADTALAESPDSPDIAPVLLIKLVALLNLQRVAECPAVLDTVWRYLQRPDATVPAQKGKFHALAAEVAYYQGSLQRCMVQLVRGTRIMESAPADHESMLAWITVADVYSLVGFHTQAVAALANARKISENGTVEDRVYTAHPRILVRYALFLDQQGNQHEASAILDELTKNLGPDDVNGSEHPYLGYAIARHAVTGGPQRSDARALLRADAAGTPQNAELIHLGDAALATAEGRPGEALSVLEDTSMIHSLLGLGEVPRLRSLAQAALGDYQAAHDSALEVTRVLGEATGDLYGLVIGGVTDSLNYEEVRRNLRRYADEALTDPLTGLPNRRHFERYIGELVGRGGSGTLGVADLNRFKAVNTVHGHLAGDQVLEQAAGLIASSLRRGDFLARYGGDEFVLFMPDTTVADSRGVADRLTAAVADYDWEHLVPGTPVSVTVGLAELDRVTSVAEAFQTADILMLEAKVTPTQAARATVTDTGTDADADAERSGTA